MKKNREKIDDIHDNKYLVSILKKNGYKVTRGRIFVLEVFSKYHIPLSAGKIFEHISESKIDEATIYRTLKSFEKKGILKRVDLRSDSVYFELNNLHHHHHLVCKRCGDIEDVDICEIDRLNDKVIGRSLKFNSIIDHSLEFFGVCKSCDKKFNSKNLHN